MAGADTSGRDWPRVSVIVAVYNGEATLGPCIESLLRLDYPAAQLELICVDNASTDDTARILSTFGSRLRVFREEKRGPAAARNCGVRQASGDVIAITDADCVVAPDWLRYLVPPLRDPDIGVVGGRILSRRPCNAVEMFGERIHDHARALTISDPPYAITMNWAARRVVLNRMGRFNEALLRSSDVDFSYRLRAAGYRFAYAPDAIVYHRNERTLWGLMHEGYVHGFHAPRVHQLHHEFLRQNRGRRARDNGAAPPPVQSESWKEQLLWRLFRLGKRIGRLHGAWAEVKRV